MNILVTGGAGYVGSVVVAQLLAAGHHVRVLDSLLHGGHALMGVWSHPQFAFIRGDVRDRAVVLQAIAGRDAVVHLAAIVGDPACARAPDLAQAVNCKASLALLMQCRSGGIARFVFASTCSNYGKMEDPHQYVDETSELRPVSLYAETKVAVERAVLDPSMTDAVCGTSLRFATVYGVSPRMRFDLTVNEFTLEMVQKKSLQVFGENFWRPYIHVRDAARAIQAVVEAPRALVQGNVFNVGATAENYRKADLVELIRPFAPDAQIEFVQRNEDPRDYRVTFEKIRATLGFAPGRVVTDGVREIVQLIRDGVVTGFDQPYYRN